MITSSVVFVDTNCSSNSNFLLEVDNNSDVALPSCKVHITRIFTWPRYTAAVAGCTVTLEVFRTTASGTGGTNFTASGVKLDSSDAAIPSGIIVQSSSTSITTSGVPICGMDFYIDDGATYNGQFNIYEYNEMGHMKPILLRPGECIVCRVTGFKLSTVIGAKFGLGIEMDVF